MRVWQDHGQQLFENQKGTAAPQPENRSGLTKRKAV